MNCEISSYDDTFNLQYLSQCYDHIICVHSFCLNSTKRKMIIQYIAAKAGKCTMGRSCFAVQNHGSRKREISKKQLQQSHVDNGDDVLTDILKSCLNSLHCYLLHDVDQLYIIDREDRYHGLRFQPKENPLQFVDEFDEFILFITTASQGNTFVTDFINWLFVEEYEWESLLNDIHSYNIDDIEKQSNVYLFLQKK
eukprot:50938_1